MKVCVCVRKGLTNQTRTLILVQDTPAGLGGADDDCNTCKLEAHTLYFLSHLVTFKAQVKPGG